MSSTQLKNGARGGSICLKYVLLPILITILSFPVNAQFRNICLTPDVVLKQAGAPAIVINRSEPNNIVVAAMNKIYVTTDKGSTWKNTGITSAYTIGTSYSLVSDRKGELYNFFTARATVDGPGYDRIVCQRSEDGGITWEELGITALDSSRYIDNTYAILPPRADLYITWTRFDSYKSTDSNQASYVMLSKSKDGRKWSAPVLLNQLEGDCEDDDGTIRGATPAVASDGKMFAAWAVNRKIYMDRALDKGNTWLRNDIPVENQYGGWRIDVPGLSQCNGLPMLMVDMSPGKFNGCLYLIWADQRNGENDTDVWFARSMNFGDNWTSPLRINNDAKGKHQFMPRMAVDQTNGNIYVVYYDRRAYDDASTDVYLAWSRDQGNSFTNIKLSESPFLPDNDNLGDYIGIDAHNGVITPVWTRAENGKISIWTAIIKDADLADISAAK